MLYAIIGRDVPDSLPARLAARPAHLERLRHLQDQGRVVIAGPFPVAMPLTPAPASAAACW